MRSKMLGLGIVLTALPAVALPTGATAAPPRHYFPKPHAACRTDYVRRTVKVKARRHGRPVTVKRAECVYQPPSVAFYWCSRVPTNPQPYNTTCSSPTSKSGNPPNPLNIGAGKSVTLDAYVSGSKASDVSPAGYITYAISGPPGSSYTAQWWNQGLIEWDPGCAKVYDNGGDASGECQIVFNTVGTYRVKLSFTDGDGQYRNATGPTEIVRVS